MKYYFDEQDKFYEEFILAMNAKLFMEKIIGDVCAGANAGAE